MPSRDLTLKFVRLVTDPDSPLGVECPSCRDLLTVHQPDVEGPDRLLGVCPACHDWFLIDASVEVIARLPHWDVPRKS
jgi:hypothetical protein